MSTTAVLRHLGSFVPESGTEMMRMQALGHKIRAYPGDDSWAKKLGQDIDDVREQRIDGDSRRFRNPYCIPCMKTGRKVYLLDMGGRMQCGNAKCGWIRPERLGDAN